MLPVRTAELQSDREEISGKPTPRSILQNNCTWQNIKAMEDKTLGLKETKDGRKRKSMGDHDLDSKPGENVFLLISHVTEKLVRS